MEVPGPCHRMARSRGTPIKPISPDATAQPVTTHNPQLILRSAACAFRARLPGALGARSLAINVNGGAYWGGAFSTKSDFPNWKPLYFKTPLSVKRSLSERRATAGASAAPLDRTLYSSTRFLGPRDSAHAAKNAGELPQPGSLSRP